MEIVFQLEPVHFNVYQQEVARRTSTRERTEKVPLVQRLSGLLIWLLVVVLITTAELVITRVKGGVPNYPEQLLGFFAGAAAVLVVSWEQARRASQAVLRPDVQVARERRLVLAPDGLRISGNGFETLYRWGDIKEATTHRDAVIVWTAPDLGVVVPRSAFANEADMKAFAETIRSRIVGAKLPQARPFP